MRTPVSLRRRRPPGAVAPGASSVPDGGPPDTACFAPSVQMFIHPDGEVRPCCVHLAPYGNVRHHRLVDIWTGAARRDLVDRLAVGDYSAGCENCEAEIAMEGREHSYSSFFSRRAGHLTADPASAAWPRWIDFNLSTTCNLQCIQCSGELSSSIRIHREKRAPLASPFGDEFFDDLRAFIPHLDGALFAGGEPFLAAENYRVWDLIEELNPDLHCIITTNGTQWNDRVVSVIDRLRCSFVLSIDGYSAETFEAVRVGARRDLVFDNAERFVRHARQHGRDVSVNHCLMVQNHHEFADLLSWADDLDLPVSVSVVRTPPECSIARLPADELALVHESLLARDDEMRARLRTNRETWSTELERVGAWRRSSASGASEWGKWGRTVMMFRCEGAAPHDDAAALGELAAIACDGVVHAMDVGADDLIHACSPSIGTVLGVAEGDLVGHHFATVEDVSVRAFGERSSYRVLSEGPDRLDAEAVYGETRLRIAMVACRDATGRAESGRILVAVVR